MCVCEWEEAGPGCGRQGTVGSITHGLKIKKPLEVFTGPRMIINPTALAPGQNTLCSPSPISTGGQPGCLLLSSG